MSEHTVQPGEELTLIGEIRRLWPASGGMLGVLLLIILVCLWFPFQRWRLNEALIDAAGRGDHAQIESLLRRGADLQAREVVFDIPIVTPAQRWNALDAAAASGRLETAQLLIAKGAQPCAEQWHGMTALWLAAVRGHAPVVRLLLDHGCDASTHAMGFSALESARKEGHHEVVRLLRQRGAKYDSEGAGNDRVSPSISAQ